MFVLFPCFFSQSFLFLVIWDSWINKRREKYSLKMVNNEVFIHDKNEIKLLLLSPVCIIQMNSGFQVLANQNQHILWTTKRKTYAHTKKKLCSFWFRNPKKLNICFCHFMSLSRLSYFFTTTKVIIQIRKHYSSFKQSHNKFPLKIKMEQFTPFVTLFTTFIMQMTRFK